MYEISRAPAGVKERFEYSSTSNFALLELLDLENLVCFKTKYSYFSCLA